MACVQVRQDPGQWNPVLLQISHLVLCASVSPEDRDDSSVSTDPQEPPLPIVRTAVNTLAIIYSLQTALATYS